MLSLGTLLRLMCSSVLELSYYKVAILNPTEVRAFCSLCHSTHSSRVSPATEARRVPEGICGVPVCAWHLPSSKERGRDGGEHRLRALLRRIGADLHAPLGPSNFRLRWGRLFSGSTHPFPCFFPFFLSPLPSGAGSRACWDVPGEAPSGRREQGRLPQAWSGALQAAVSSVLPIA